MTTCQEKCILLKIKIMIVTLHIGEFKARFSELIELTKKGVIIKVIKGKSGELVGYFGKEYPDKKRPKSKLGFFADQKVTISQEDLQWTDEELTNMGL
ncbi:hypothetical protein B879_00033 [Cecembia lonarensis LW9]|uniref:Prevent-host-death family protein n=2 Tax=Cecembia TaxID=1187078 RepID=K1M4W8_CECL9|nr:hypothetical protein B879_00033 [Cecembia lonarensis LW9]